MADGPRIDSEPMGRQRRGWVRALSSSIGDWIHRLARTAAFRRLDQTVRVGNKVMVGTVNAHRDDFVTGVEDLLRAEAFYPGWLEQLITNRVGGLDRFDEMLRHLEDDHDAIKVVVEVGGGDRIPRRDPASIVGRPERRRPRRRAKAATPGIGGVRTSPIGSGGRSARTTRPAETRGRTCRTITARSRPIAGARTASSGSATSTPRLCFAIALWNERDPILKERLFGLTGPEGNHGEDVKEAYFSRCDAHGELPPGALQVSPGRVPVRRARRRERPAQQGRSRYELADTGAFDDDRYFDIEVEYAKASATDIAIRISVTNRGPEPAPIHLLPTLWFRNTWAWGIDDRRPLIRAVDDPLLQGLAGTTQSCAPSTTRLARPG